ncbi:hypothetical protein G5714_019948 [Onychostoma macrolepis]|uniref:Uncharacterized protein n=1 Tax=Onychostoma macrolepis TaxID=369639 RepID=A0A7J6C1Q8_9TELE|nr:hypothetical protein G5714_019948 [Onychostoma macrolepis]
MSLCRTFGGPTDFPDTHNDCVLCLGRAYAEAALEGSDCQACEELSIKILRARLAVVRRGQDPDRHQLSDRPDMLVASLSRHFIRGSLRNPASERSRHPVSRFSLWRKKSSVPDVHARRKRARSVHDNGPAAKRACSCPEFTRRLEAKNSSSLADELDIKAEQ